MSREKMSRVIVIFFGVICLGLGILLIKNVSSLYWIAGLGWALISLGFFGVMAYFNWIENSEIEFEIRNGKFCEHFNENSKIGQPINTLTNLSFVAAGLTVILIAGKHIISSSSPMADPKSYVPLIYGLIVIFLGPGSMLFHASGKKWAGWFDSFSMVAWIGYSFSFTVSRLMPYIHGPTSILGISTLAFLAIVIILPIGVANAIWGLRFASTDNKGPDVGFIAIAIPAILWVILEVITMFLIWGGQPIGFRRHTSWFIAIGIVYIAAFVCWIPSNGEIQIVSIRKQWCKPHSWYQGHGFWHIFSAMGALLIYLHYASESPV